MDNKVAYIEWIDASGAPGPFDISEAISNDWDLTMYTAGILIEETEDRVIIAQDTYHGRVASNNPRCRDVEVIPRRYITRMQLFQPKKGKK